LLVVCRLRAATCACHHRGSRTCAHPRTPANPDAYPHTDCNADRVQYALPDGDFNTHKNAGNYDRTFRIGCLSCDPART
jgi:hypothetical protein